MAKARKEIDKDSMYQKIMPSAMRSVQPAEESAPETPAVKKAPPKPKASPSAGRASATAASRAARAAALAAEPEEEQQSEQPVVAASPVSTPEDAQKQTPIINLMERLIEAKLDVAIEKFHCCNCEKCRQDIAAMALNKLHPRYIVAEPELLAQGMEDKEANTQVTTALVQAILKVKANPKHEQLF